MKASARAARRAEMRLNVTAGWGGGQSSNPVADIEEVRLAPREELPEDVTESLRKLVPDGF